VVIFAASRLLLKTLTINHGLPLSQKGGTGPQAPPLNLPLDLQQNFCLVENEAVSVQMVKSYWMFFLFQAKTSCHVPHTWMVIMIECSVKVTVIVVVTLYLKYTHL